MINWIKRGKFSSKGQWTFVPLPHITFSNGVNAMVRLDILAEVCTITRMIFKAYVRMNDVQRTVL